MPYSKLNATEMVPTILLPWGKLGYQSRLSLMENKQLWKPKYFGSNHQRDALRRHQLIVLANEALDIFGKKKHHHGGGIEALMNREYSLHYDFFMVYNYLAPYISPNLTPR